MNINELKILINYNKTKPFYLLRDSIKKVKIEVTNRKRRFATHITEKEYLNMLIN